MKRIIDIDEDYYEMLKYNVENGQKYKPWEIIVNGTPYEPKKEIVPVCKVTFDKEELQKIVDEKVAELVIGNERMQGEWITYDVDITPHPLHCKNCGWSNHHIKNEYIKEFKVCPDCGAKMRGEENGNQN